MEQDHKPQYPDNGGVPPMPAPPTPSGDFQQGQMVSNESEQRAKRRMYSFIQIISVVLLLISCPFIIIALIEIGPQFGKTESTIASVTKITTDLGGIIDEATGLTDLSKGCQVHYDFVANNKLYSGSAHSETLCAIPVGSTVDVVHSPSLPDDNTIVVDWDPYITYLIVGSILLALSLIVVIGSSALKSKAPKPIKQKSV